MGYKAKVNGYIWRQKTVEIRLKINSVLTYLEQQERELTGGAALANNRQHQIELYQTLSITKEMLDMEE